MKNISKVRIAKFLNQEIGSKKIDQRIVSLFLKQLSLLLGSGLSLDDSLKIIKDQKLDRRLSKTLSKILEDLNQGIGVSEAFDKAEKSFDKITLAFIKSGDKSGKLPDILEDLSKHIAEEYEKKSQIKQALIYPIILFVVTILVVIAMMVFVLPTFVSVFESSGQNLPLSTKILLNLSNLIVSYGTYIFLMLLIIILSLIILRRNFAFRVKMDEVIFKKLLFKNFRNLNIEYQTSSLLGILRRGDIDIIETMVIIKDGFKNEYIKKKINQIIENLILGKSISQSFKEVDIYSNLLTSMIEIGEGSGNMIETMDKTSSYLSNEYLYRLKKISQMAEPFLIILMALIVGFVVFSVAIPMFDTVNGISF